MADIPSWWLDEFGEYEGWGEFAWETMQKHGFSRDTMIPLSVVKALLAQQSDFNKSLVSLLGSHLEKASENYRDALNPPVDSSAGPEMSYSTRDEHAEDLLHQIEMGIINPNDVTSNMRKILADADLSIETN